MSDNKALVDAIVDSLDKGDSRWIKEDKKLTFAIYPTNNFCFQLHWLEYHGYRELEGIHRKDWASLEEHTQMEKAVLRFIGRQAAKDVEADKLWAEQVFLKEAK